MVIPNTIVQVINHHRLEKITRKKKVTRLCLFSMLVLIKLQADYRAIFFYLAHDHELAE